jgi:hypothetical protein
MAATTSAAAAVSASLSLATGGGSEEYAMLRTSSLDRTDRTVARAAAQSLALVMPAR